MQIIMLKFFVVSDSKRFLGHLMLAVYLEVTELLFEHIQSQENDLLWFQCIPSTAYGIHRNFALAWKSASHMKLGHIISHI